MPDPGIQPPVSPPSRPVISISPSPGAPTTSAYATGTAGPVSGSATSPKSGIHRRSAPSVSSIAEIAARSRDKARRLSMSSTPQSGAAAAVVMSPAGGWSEKVASRVKVYLGAVITGVVLLGIGISLIFNTSLDTSALRNTVPLRTAYFAQKSNFLNQLFVKKCWGWTSLFFLLHLATSPSTSLYTHATSPSLLPFVPGETWAGKAPGRQTRTQRLAAFVIASALWVVFTSWFFGAGLGDRIILLSGGRCAVPLPEWAESAGEHALSALTKSSLNILSPGESLIRPLGSNQVYLPLPQSFCQLRRPLTPSSHPDLFALLHRASTSSSSSSLSSTFTPPPRLFPRWAGGFDVSGHAFLLTLSALILAHELAPSWSSLLDTTPRPPAADKARSARARNAPIARAVHLFSTWAGTALVALWVWMIFATAVYFHNPPEKISGLVLGLLASLFVDILTPRKLASPTIEFKPTPPDASPFSDSISSPATYLPPGSHNISHSPLATQPPMVAPVNDENSARREENVERTKSD